MRKLSGFPARAWFPEASWDEQEQRAEKEVLMAWVKWGDDADMYPRADGGRPHPKADSHRERAVWIHHAVRRLPAAHLTDSVIEMGVAHTYAGNPTL